MHKTMIDKLCKFTKGFKGWFLALKTIAKKILNDIIKLQVEESTNQTKLGEKEMS